MVTRKAAKIFDEATQTGVDRPKTEKKLRQTKRSQMMDSANGQTDHAADFVPATDVSEPPDDIFDDADRVSEPLAEGVTLYRVDGELNFSLAAPHLGTMVIFEPDDKEQKPIVVLGCDLDGPRESHGAESKGTAYIGHDLRYNISWRDNEVIATLFLKSEKGMVMVYVYGDGRTSRAEFEGPYFI